MLDPFFVKLRRFPPICRWDKSHPASAHGVLWWRSIYFFQMDFRWHFDSELDNWDIGCQWHSIYPHGRRIACLATIDLVGESSKHLIWKKGKGGKKWWWWFFFFTLPHVPSWDDYYGTMLMADQWRCSFVSELESYQKARLNGRNETW